MYTAKHCTKQKYHKHNCWLIMQDDIDINTKPHNLTKICQTPPWGLREFPGQPKLITRIFET